MHKLFTCISYELQNLICLITITIVGSVVEWLKHRTDDQHGLGSKPTCAIAVSLGKTLYGTFPCLVVLASSSKLLADSNILASPEVGRGNCLPYV